MPDYTEVHRTIDVPPGSGVDGVLRTIETILKQTRVQEIHIRRGKVEYKRYIRDDQPEDELKVDLSTLMPMAVVRNTLIEEITPLNDNAAVIISQLFAAATKDGYNAIGFACSPNSTFWAWHGRTTGVVLNQGEAYGIPIFLDGDFPEEVLVLCAAFSREARLVDTQKAYKVTIPAVRRKA